MGELCHRDIEYLGIGIPFFRKTFKCNFANKLEPNKHYYSIGGDKVGIDKTMEHFCKIFEPNEQIPVTEELPNYKKIAENGIELYEKNCTRSASLKYLADILER